MLFVLSLAWDKKNSEFPQGIEPQTFGFRAPMFYHWATETPLWARSITNIISHSSCIPLRSAMSEKHLFYFFTELKTYYLSVSYFYLQTLRHRHGWFQPWSLCGSVVEHRNAESEGLRFDSSWRHRFFFLYPMLVTWRKTSFSFFTKLKTYHLSYFYLKRSCKNNSKCTPSYKCWKLILISLCRSFRFRVPQCQPVTA